MAAETLRRHIRTLLLRQQRRCGVALADCCCDSRGVEASHSQTAVAAAEALRRHIRRLLLRQQRRCGVTLGDLCYGSRDVAASHSHTAVAAAETLQRHIRRPLLRQQRRYGVTLEDCCCGSRAFVVPTPACCAAPAPATGYISQGAAQVQMEECILRCCGVTSLTAAASSKLPSVRRWS